MHMAIILLYLSTASDSLIDKRNKTELILAKIELQWPITFQDFIKNLVFRYFIDLEVSDNYMHI